MCLHVVVFFFKYLQTGFPPLVAHLCSPKNNSFYKISFWNFANEIVCIFYTRLPDQKIWKFRLIARRPKWVESGVGNFLDVDCKISPFLCEMWVALFIHRFQKQDRMEMSLVGSNVWTDVLTAYLPSPLSNPQPYRTMPFGIMRFMVPSFLPYVPILFPVPTPRGDWNNNSNGNTPAQPHTWNIVWGSRTLQWPYYPLGAPYPRDGVKEV